MARTPLILKVPEETVIGIDPSLTATGLCIVRDGRESVTSLWATEPGTPIPARLISLRRRLLEVVHNARPVLVAMESETFGMHAQSTTAAVQAIFQTALWDCDQEPAFRFLSVNPSHVKKYLGAKQKQEVLLQVYKRFGREFKNDNEADAFAIAMIGTAFLAYLVGGKIWPEATKPQVEVLEKLRQTGLVWETLLKPKKTKRSRL